MINYIPLRFPNNFIWRVKTEPVFRILDDTRWMKNFFDNGEIMLSCFNKFRNYQDEMQGDRNEGEAFISGFDNDGNFNGIIYEAGLNAYVLSTTTILNEKVKHDFNGKCAIKINDPTPFAVEVAKKLPYCEEGIEGRCIYVDSRTHLFESDSQNNKQFQSMGFNNSNHAHKILQQITMGNELFLKLNKYQHQNEYRFVWFSEKKLLDSIIIQCPEAVRFCEEVYFEGQV